MVDQLQATGGQHLQSCSPPKTQVLVIGSQTGLNEMVRRSEGISVENQ